MEPLRTGPSSRLIERLALAGLLLATLGLGALALWSAAVTQNHAQGLTRAGVQTSGHLRAVQSLSMIDTQTDELEDRLDPAELAALRKAERILDDSLDRMEFGGVVDARRIARNARPAVERLKPAIARFLAVPREGQDERLVAAENEMEAIMGALQVHLNDLESDPSRLLATELEAVTATERTVVRTGVALVPIGLVFVAICAWLLRSYRRRTETTLGSALALSTQEARTDQLTGLANRRALYEELAERTDRDQRLILALADLNGFKQYNDTYGHPAGDALLRRLSVRLQEACGGDGFAARLGGDEFCVLLPETMPLEHVETLVSAALEEEGLGFHVTSACGAVKIPDEAGSAQDAVRLADRRMYATKFSSRPTIDHLASDVLVRMLDERHPGLGNHVEEVAELAGACARELGLDEPDVADVQRGSRLHDIGKLAIPESIVNKPGPLTDDEWDFMRRHPVIGERVLGASPSLNRVAALVRASHERWDGAGYPDRIAGDGIPLGARIVAVADAFSAMTEARPYATARSVESTIAELRACSGTQFDPAVVDAFITVQRRATPLPVAV